MVSAVVAGPDPSKAVVVRKPADGPAMAPQRWRFVKAASSGAQLAAALAASVAAQTPITTNGLPPQVIPQVNELGMPNFAIPTGTTNPFTGSDQGTGDENGSDTGVGNGASDTGAGGNVGSSDALNTMMQQSWGTQAISESQSLGVNPTAIAATCVVESGCQNIANVSGSSATGPFQMMPSTFGAMYAEALRDDPSLAATTTGSINDPASEAAASAEYLKQGAIALQSAGISDPTVLQTRGYYNFGSAYGVQLASAPDDEPMANVLSGMSQSALATNGITAGETVGQWRSTVSAKLGNAANQSVLGS
jgi:hypothetical protein